MEFKQEVASLYPWILRKAYYLCHNMEDAKDLTMTVVCKMLENAHLFNNDAPIKPWCKVILRNTFCTWYNRKKLIEFVDISEASNMPVTTPAPDEIVSAKILLRSIRKRAHHSKNVNEVILYARGYSYDEIGKLYNIPTGTVRSRIFIGRKSLKYRI